jgi:hypothetical protein
VHAYVPADAPVHQIKYQEGEGEVKTTFLICGPKRKIILVITEVL